MRTKKIPRVRVPLAMALFISSIAAGFLVSGVYWVGRQHRIATTWANVDAQVAAPAIHTMRIRSTTYYYSEVELRYRAEGMERAVPFALSRSRSEEGARARIVELAPAGRRTVWYSPEDANRIEIHVGSPLRFYTGPLSFLGSGVVLSLVCVWMWKLVLAYEPLRCSQCRTALAPEHDFCFHCGHKVEGGRKRIQRKKWQPERHASNPKALVLVGLFFGLAGIGVMAAAAWLAVRQAGVLAAWPVAEAEVLDVDVSRQRSQTGFRFTVRPRFRYIAGTQEMVAPAQLRSTQNYAAAERQRERFRARSRHTIHYNPGKPDDVRAEAESLRAFLPAFGAGLLGLIFASAGGGCVYAWRRSRRVCQGCRRHWEKRWRFCPFCSRPVEPVADA